MCRDVIASLFFLFRKMLHPHPLLLVEGNQCTCATHFVEIKFARLAACRPGCRSAGLPGMNECRYILCVRSIQVGKSKFGLMRCTGIPTNYGFHCTPAPQGEPPSRNFSIFQFFNFVIIKCNVFAWSVMNLVLQKNICA